MNLIIYGGLLNRDQLHKTIKPRPYEVVKVPGYKRKFNLVPSRIQLYKDKADQLHRTVLNVVASDTSCNAIMIEVTEDEFNSLKIRERSYNSKKIKIGEKEAYLFVGKSKLFGEEILDNELKPIKPYLERVLQGAKTISDEFYEEFLDTTFLGDDTPLRKYLTEDL